MSVKYDDYKKMANQISYWIIKNNVKVKKRKEYTLKIDGKVQKKTYDEVKKIILKNRTTTNAWGRKFLEAMVLDNKDTSLFPNYVTYNGKEYKKDKYIYMAKYVIAWWKDSKHTKAPSSVPTEKKTNPVKKLYSYLTSKGCSGMGQCTAYNCACNALQQSFYRLTGIKVSESTIAAWAGTTTSGTDHEGINTAVAKFNKKYGTNIKIVWYNFKDVGWAKLAELCKIGAVFGHIAYRRTSAFEGYGHYEVIKSISGDTVVVLNSLGDRCNYPSYCGYTETRTKSTELFYMQGISQKSIAYLYV